jgi:hypothetical protein
MIGPVGGGQCITWHPGVPGQGLGPEIEEILQSTVGGAFLTRKVISPLSALSQSIFTVVSELSPGLQAATLYTGAFFSFAAKSDTSPAVPSRVGLSSMVTPNERGAASLPHTGATMIEASKNNNMFFMITFSLCIAGSNLKCNA